MLKKYLKILSNPLLYYVDKSGNSIFRNFCLFETTGCLYKMPITKPNAGQTLEYKMQLDKQLKMVYFLTPVVLYFIFIHIKFSLFGLLFFELLWLAIVNVARIKYSEIYSRHLMMKFGKYELVEFAPDIPQQKIEEFAALFKSKIMVLLIVIALFFVPALVLRFVIKLNINSGKGYKQAAALSNLYFSVYPKSERIYDMRSLAKAANRDFEGALKDYKTVLDMSGKRFTQKDVTRFENLLYLQKKVSTPTDAVDVFNEYLTKKNLSTLQNSQMLWVKSIFRIENNIPEGIEEEYDEQIEALDKKDNVNRFYLSCDKAYMLYLMKEYASALTLYNILISFAQAAPDKYQKDLSRLYAERGFAKKQLGDIQGAQIDFLNSQINPAELRKYEPAFAMQNFVVEKF